MMDELERNESFTRTYTTTPTPPPSAVLSATGTGLKHLPSSHHLQANGNGGGSGGGQKKDSKAKSKHWSIFYEKEGIEAQPPASLHYLHLGCWATDTCDFYLHRRPRKGEPQGQTVVWLHTANPRDRFVFLITPVDEPGKQHNLYAMLWSFLYGNPPAFNVTSDRKNLFDALKKKHREGAKKPRTGVEAVEVLHSDVTAMDYGPGLTCSRLAIETKTARCKWFFSKDEALKYYGCMSTKRLIEERFATPPAPSLSMPGTPAMTHDGLKLPPPFSLNDGEVSGRSSRHTSPQLGPSAPPGVPSTGRPGSFGSAPPTHGATTGDGLMDDIELELPPAATSSSLPSAVATVTCSLSENRTLSPAEIEAMDNDNTGATGDLVGVAAILSRRASMYTPGQRSGTDTPSGSPNFPHPCGGAAKAAATAVVSDDTSTPSPSDAASPTGSSPPVIVTGSSTNPIVSPYHNTMVIIYTQDPHFNAVLREFLMPEPGTHPFAKNMTKQKRLLSLYETGMPAWPIFFSRYGLPYRRWFRLVAVAIINIWPVIALCVGLYDLYKHMPFLKEWMSDTLTPFTQWMEHHFTLRISMLVTYLFTVSFNIVQSFHSFIKSAVAVFTFAFSPLLPILSFLSILKYPLMIVWQFLLQPIFVTGFSGLTFIWVTLSTPFRLVAYGFRLMFGASQVKSTVQSASYFMVWWRSFQEFWDKVARPIKNLAKACYDGTVHVGVALVRREASLRRWYTSLIFRMTGFLRFIVRTILDIIFYNFVAIHYQQLKWRWLHGIIMLSVAAAISGFVVYLRNGGVLPLVEMGCDLLERIGVDDLSRGCDVLMLSLLEH